MNYGVGILVFIGSVILLVKANGILSIFWDLPTFLFVLFGSLGLLVANKSIDEIKAFGLDVKLYFIRSLERIGAIGAVIGFIQMLQNFSDPKSIGPSMAVCLLSVFYAQVLANIIKFQNSKSLYLNLTVTTIGVVVGSFFVVVLALS